MKNRLLALILSLTATAALALSASAAQTHEVPVTLTVVNTQQRISVTVPASLPVSVVDGVVITATNAAVRNTADEGVVRIAAVEVTDGSLTVGDYDHFEEAPVNTIALRLNGCPTRGAGELVITDEAFPAIEAGDSLALDYDAKVSTVGEPRNETAATVVFTIATAE
ncbi:MAG TPA: hypothetical protein IAC25_07920 [Candidatus Enterenecus stercoripullorum]|nr:hypothetical protein [Candidatus Enterenecus stercoripullorum]